MQCALQCQKKRLKKKNPQLIDTKQQNKQLILCRKIKIKTKNENKCNKKSQQKCHKNKIKKNAKIITK